MTRLDDIVKELQELSDRWHGSLPAGKTIAIVTKHLSKPATEGEIKKAAIKITCTETKQGDYSYLPDAQHLAEAALNVFLGVKV